MDEIISLEQFAYLIGAQYILVMRAIKYYNERQIGGESTNL